MTIGGAARLAGVAGDPVAHSLSPRLHGHWLETLGIDGAYVPLAIRREDFATSLQGLRKAGFRGVNVTVPHKEAAFALSQRLDDAARATGAVNLLLFGESGFEGRNTDVEGLTASLGQSAGADAFRNRVAAIFGAGGAARAAVLALSQMGAGEIRVFARDTMRATAMLRDVAPFASAKLGAFAWTQWPDAAGDVALLLNATSAGMRGKQPLTQPLDSLPTDAHVCDIVYNPLETGLLAAARARGNPAIDGLGMLMHQAVPSFEAFYCVRPQVTAGLRKVLEGALHG
jgi:shikimate dehydrogenase